MVRLPETICENFDTFLLFPGTFRNSKNLIVFPVSEYFLYFVCCFYGFWTLLDWCRMRSPPSSRARLEKFTREAFFLLMSWLAPAGRRTIWPKCVKNIRFSIGWLPLKIWLRLVRKMWIVYSVDKALRHDLALALSCGQHNERDQGKASLEIYILKLAISF